MDKQNRIHWEFLVAAGALIFAILGVVIPLFMHLDNKFYQLLQLHYDEIKEVHLKISMLEKK